MEPEAAAEVVVLFFEVAECPPDLMGQLWFGLMVVLPLPSSDCNNGFKNKNRESEQWTNMDCVRENAINLGYIFVEGVR